MGNATHVLYYATRYGYAVDSYDDDGQPVTQYRAGNHPGDSQATIELQKRYEPGAVRPVPLRTLKKWARETALETAKEAGIESDRVSYDQDGADDEIEMMESNT